MLERLLAAKPDMIQGTLPFPFDHPLRFFLRLFRFSDRSLGLHRFLSPPCRSFISIIHGSFNPYQTYIQRPSHPTPGKSSSPRSSSTSPTGRSLSPSSMPCSKSGTRRRRWRKVRCGYSLTFSFACRCPVSPYRLRPSSASLRPLSPIALVHLIFVCPAPIVSASLTRYRSLPRRDLPLHPAPRPWSLAIEAHRRPLPRLDCPFTARRQ